MELKSLKAKMEAVLFAHAEPLSAAKLSEILTAEQSLIEKMLLVIRDDCEAEDRGIHLIQLEDAWQFATKPCYGDTVKIALDNRRNTPLTPAALEVLAIIAYNQPVSRGFIEQVRGVDSSGTVAGLVEKGLITEAGRLDLPGKPLSFKTTDVFLRTFGITSLAQLPPLHNEQAQNEEAGMYPLPGNEADEMALAQGLNEPEDEAPTVALRGGVFIEGEGGAADWIGMNE